MKFTLAIAALLGYVVATESITGVTMLDAPKANATAAAQADSVSASSDSGDSEDSDVEVNSSTDSSSGDDLAQE